MSTFCSYLPHFCTLLQEGFLDLDDKIDNSARIAVKEAHSPQGSGWKCLLHYAQIIKAKQFQRYDFGKTENLKKYGQEKPPMYDLSKVSLKMAIAHGDVDQLSDLQDVAWLMDQSQSGLRVDELVVFQQVYHYGHNSFGMASDMKYLYDVMDVIRKVNNL